jgi:hypothetical protein
MFEERVGTNPSRSNEREIWDAIDCLVPLGGFLTQPGYWGRTTPLDQFLCQVRLQRSSLGVVFA